MLGAVEVAVKRAMAKAGQEADRRTLLAEAVDSGPLPDAAAAHYPLPIEQQLRLALSALDQAMGRQLLPHSQGALLREILDGKPPSQAALERGVSPSAISHRVKKTAERLGRMIERGEVTI